MSNHHHQLHTDYLEDLFATGDSLREHMAVVDECIKSDLQDKGLSRLPQHSHFAVSGVSGLAFGSAYSVRKRKSLLVVRKEDVKCHTTNKLEGCPKYDQFNYMLVDDLVCTGTTMEYIIRKIAGYNPRARCQGIIFFRCQAARAYQPLSEILSTKIKQALRDTGHTL